MTVPTTPTRTDMVAIADIVRAELRGETSSETAEWLRREGLGYWIQELNAVKKDIEAQFAERKAEAAAKHVACLKMLQDEGKQAWHEYEVDYLRWRKRAGWMKAKVEARLAEAKRLQREGNDKRFAEVVKRENEELRSILTANGLGHLVPAREAVR